MRSPYWTIEEIQSGPKFGGKIGWFYGLVKDHEESSRCRIYEIYPGLGYARTGWIPWPKNWWWIIKDIMWATKRKY